MMAEESGKYRVEKIKKEHTIIEGILPLLQDVARITYVKSIIPGRINRRSGSGMPPQLQLKYNTPSGIKILGKNSKSVQEVFVVTDNAERTITILKAKKMVK